MEVRERNKRKGGFIMEKIEFIGIGNMGGKMEENMVKEGNKVRGLDILKKNMEEEKEKGIEIEESDEEEV